MKNWMWSLLCGVIAFLLVAIFDIPLWLFFLVFFPVLLSVLTYSSFKYNFRQALQPEPVPARGYEDRIADLEKTAGIVQFFGFRKTDVFYMKIIPDAVVYAFKHDSVPDYLLIYNFGVKKGMDYISYFENDITLTTCSRVDGGSTPRPPRRLLQIIVNAPPFQMYEYHCRAKEYMRSKGLRPIDIPGSVREGLMRSMREFDRHVRSRPFWLFRLLYCVLTKYGKRYLISIEEQHRQGAITIF